jgi:molybdate transport system regulatory protein
MVKATKSKKPPRIRPRIRVYSGDEVALGPGKVELLRCIAETGSLSEAARSIKMSYMKAWLLVQIMNRCFKKPLVILERGGSGGGRTEVTEFGHKVLGLYVEMESASLTAMKPAANKLTALLRS